MNRIIAIFLAIALLTMSCKESLIRIVFHLNQSYIALNLCENRDKPELKCEGKCHLKKTLKQNREKEKKSAENNNNKKKELVFIERFETTSQRYFCSFPVLKTLVNYTNHYFFDFSFKILRPPQSTPLATIV